jgi:FkbM family methyltransferase
MLSVIGTFNAVIPYNINKTIHLNLEDMHEKLYMDSLLGGKNIIDYYIAKKFIRAGDVVADIGANIGFCSLLYLMHGASKIFAFEPHPVIFNRLNTLAGEDLIPFELALSDTIGSAELIISSKHNQGHTLNPAWIKEFPCVFGDNPEKCIIKTSTLDEILGDEKIDFLKVDIEGNEIAFLRGAKSILENNPPRIIQIEIYPAVFHATVLLLRSYYKFIKRGAINIRAREIKLFNLNDTKIFSKDINPNPPTYICTNDKKIINLI